MNNIDDMKEQFLEMVEALGNLDISQTTGYKVTIMLRDALLKEELPFDLANDIVAAMEIELDDSFLEDEDFYTRVINNYARTVGNIYEQCLEDNMPNYIVTASSKLSLTYKI